MVKIMEIEDLMGNKVGNIYQIRFYRTSRKYPSGYFRMFKGIGISKNIIFKLLEKQVEWIIVDYVGMDKKKHELWIELDEFINRSERYNKPNDEQFICGLGWFIDKRYNGFYDGEELHEVKEENKKNGMVRWIENVE